MASFFEARILPASYIKVQLDCQALDTSGYLSAPDVIPTFLLTWLRLDVGQSFLFPWLTDSLEKKKALKNQESDHSLNSQEQKEKRNGTV